VTKADGTKEVVTVDEAGQVVTKMKRIIIEEAASPVNEKSAYLILCFVIVVAIIAIIGVLCVVKRCKSKDMRLEAENVDQHVKGVRCCQGDDMDNVV